MVMLWVVLLVLSTCQTTAQSAQQTSLPAPQQDYLWLDPFLPCSGSGCAGGLNSSSWNYELGDGCDTASGCGWGNGTHACDSC
jgi:hypothetical protein